MEDPQVYTKKFMLTSSASHYISTLNIISQMQAFGSGQEKETMHCLKTITLNTQNKLCLDPCMPACKVMKGEGENRVKEVCTHGATTNDNDWTLETS